ncbi:MAG TPA: MarR family transcriptional regulator [Mycobacteriales bacterium]|nr:MarR family transcriptional regulator [Mycobacteriales bacterium]
MAATVDRRPLRLSATEMAAWVGLLRAHSVVTRRLDRELEAECGLSLAQYDVLVQLERAPERRLRMTELAEQVVLSRSGLTRLVDRLVAMGLVERSYCPSDARGVYAGLTPDGRGRLAEAAVVHMRGVREHVTGKLAVAQQRALADATGQLLADR